MRSQEEYSTLGVIKNGQLKMQGRALFKQAIARFPDGVVVVEIRTNTKRTTLINRLYWSGYVHPLAEHTGYDKLAIHGYLKKRFLPNQHLMIQNTAGEVIDETDIEPTTTRLSQREFSDYLAAIEAWAVGELGVIVGSNRENAA